MRTTNTERRRKYADNIEANRAKARRHYAKHSDRLRQEQTDWRLANPLRSREIQWKSVGIPTPPYPAPAVCEQCHKPPGKRALCVDHDHKTGEFRGWLCGKCNSGLALLGDNIEGLIAAFVYLNRRSH